MSEDLIVTIKGFDEVASTITEIKAQFLELTSLVKDFADAFDVSQEVSNFAKSISIIATTVATMSSAIDILNNGGKTFSGIVGYASAALDVWSKTSKLGATASKLLETATTSLSSSFLKFIGIAGLITTAFLIFTKWDEMSGGLQVLTIALGLLSLAFLALGSSIAVSLAPFLAIAAAVAAVVGIIMLIVDACSKGDESIKAETEAIKEQTEAVKEQAKAYDDMIAKRKDSCYEILAESQMNQNMWQELQTLNETEGKTAEQKERMKYLVEELNGSLDTNIQLTEDGNNLNADTIKGIDERIEKIRAEAMAEVVAAEYKEVFTQAFRNANEIRSLLSDQEALKAKETAGTITSEEKKKLEEIEKNLKERTGLQEKFNADIVNLENMQYLASTGQDDKLTEAFMINNDIKESGALESAYTREQINGMMYEGMSEQDSIALADALAKIQKNGGNITQFLDENNKLRKDINLNYLEQMNADNSQGAYTRQEINAMMYEGMSEQDSIALAEALAIVQENGGNITQFLDENGQLRKDINLNYLEQINADLFQKQLDSAIISEEGGKNTVEGFNTGINESKNNTNGALNNWGGIISGWFGGLSLPKMGINIEYVTPSSNVLAKAIEWLKLPGLPKITFNKYALGGLPDFGELFLAREAGPELVGRFGNVNAVMNNDQIVASVSSGVYKAVMAAMSTNNSNGDKPLNITFKVGETEFGRACVNSMNSLSKQQGGLDLCY